MSNNILKTFWLLTANIVSLCALAQTNIKELEKKMAADLEQARNGNDKKFDYHFNASNEMQALSFLEKYETDSSEKVRSKVQDIEFTLAASSNDLRLRQKVVEYFIRCNTMPSLSRLAVFKEQDFTAAAKKMIMNVFMSRQDNDNFLTLCGTLPLKELLLPPLQRIAMTFHFHRESLWWSSTAWCALLAVARLGDTTNVDKMITAVELEIDPQIKVIRLFADLAYTRQPDCFRLLQCYLECNCMLPRPGRDVIQDPRYSIHALHYLAKYWGEGFPVKYDDVLRYSDEQLETARVFMRAWWKQLHPEE